MEIDFMEVELIGEIINNRTTSSLLGTLKVHGDVHNTQKLTGTHVPLTGGFPLQYKPVGLQCMSFS